MPNIQGLKGLDKLSYEGLSIIYITAFRRPKRKVDKSTNLHIYNWSISPMHEREGLSNPQNPTVYKGYPNTPIYIQTISSGYKGLDGLDNMAK